MRRLFTFAAAFFAFVGFAVVAQARTTQRPIEDFVNAQGTFCIDNGMGGCVLFVPPIENFLGNSDPARQLLASVDYAGLAADWLEDPQNNCDLAVGTTFSGTVRERSLRDGRAHVHVVLHTNNALTWVAANDGDFDNDFANSTVLFGNRAPDVCDGEEAALGKVTLIIDLINTGPGDPLPDLLQVLIAPELGQEVISLKTRARAKGALREAFGVPDGTPGRFSTTQNGLEGLTRFPVEIINLQAVGN